MRKEKTYEDWFRDMTDEEKKSRGKIVARTKTINESYVLELFKVDGNKKQMILLREPFMRDVVIDLSEDEIIGIMKNYNFFKVDVKDGIATFAQDLFSETAINAKLRLDFKRDFGKYYTDAYNTENVPF